MDEPHPPDRLDVLRESLAPLDVLTAPWVLLRASRRQIHRNGDRTGTSHPVIVLPGLGANDAAMAPMRYVLARAGHRPEGWGLGTNLGGRGMGATIAGLSDRWEVDRKRRDNGEAEVPWLVDRMIDRVIERSDTLGEPVVLVGWSLGGYVAREVARDIPERVSMVITIVAPVIGGPKFTTAAGLFRRRNVDVDWIADEVMRRFDTPITVPIKAIWSRHDGVVGWRAAIDHWSPEVEHIEISGTHSGAGFSPKVWDLLLGFLADHPADDS